MLTDSSRLASRIRSTRPPAKKGVAILLLLAILSAAFAVRLERTSIGLPYLHSPDEIRVLVEVVGLRLGSTASEGAAASRAETRSVAIEDVDRLTRERRWRRIGVAAELGTFPDAPTEIRQWSTLLNAAVRGMQAIALITGSRMDLAILNRHPGVKIVDPGSFPVEAAAPAACAPPEPPTSNRAGVLKNPVLWGAGALMLVLLGGAVLSGHAAGAGRYRTRVAALSIGLMVSLVGGELAVRSYIRKVQSANNIEILKAYKAEHQPDQPIVLADLLRIRDDDVLQYEMSPDLDVFWTEFHVRTNSAGIMGATEYSLEKGENTFRIAGLGDSGMAGLGVSCEDSYMSVLERNLNQRDSGTTYEVLNFAVVGYNTRIEEEVLVQRASAYSPDLVIVGWCINDIRPPNFLIRAPELRAENSYLWMLLSNRDAFHRMLRTKFSGVWDRDVEALPPVFRDSFGEEGVIRCFERIGERARQDGYGLLVFGPMDEWLYKALDELEIDYCNTLEQIGADDFPKEFRVHHMHPSAEGHRILAKLLEWELKERGYIAE